jgi:hypothetical protein
MPKTGSAPSCCSARFVLSAIGYASPEGGSTTVLGIGAVFVIGIGALLLGVILMVVYSRIAPPFFRGETLVPGTADMLLEPGVPHLGLPDSEERTVIAPDRSNLPPGRKPYDPSP